MADQNIDSLQLEITSSSSEAEKSLDRLTASLMGLNRSLLKIGNNAGALRSLASSLGSLERLKLPDFTNTINQLEKLSKIDLSNLNGKKVSIDFNISGMTEAERMEEAIKHASENIHKYTDKIANDLAKAYNITGAPKKQLQDIFAEMGKASASGDMQAIGGLWDDAYENIKMYGRLAATDFDSSLEYCKKEYEDFLSYMQNHKMKFSTDSRYENESTSRTDRQKYFNQKTGKNADEYDDIITSFPNVFADKLYEANRGLATLADNSVDVFERIKRAEETVNKQPISFFSDKENQGRFDTESLENKISDSITGAMSAAMSKVEGEISGRMDASIGKIPLNIWFDESKLLEDIRNAIQKAQQYAKINVQLGINADALGEEVKKAFGGIDKKNVSGLSTELSSILQSLHGFTKVDMKSTDLSPLVNSMARLSKESKGIDPKVFNELSGLFSTDFVSKIAAMGETNFQSTGLNSFVNALVRLSKESKNFDPAVFNSLSQSIQQFTQITTDVEPFAVFVKSLNSFVRNAEKMRETANIFPALAIELNEFFEAMANIDISENTVRMAEALAKVAQNGKNAGSSLASMTKDMSTTSNEIDRGKMAMDAFMKVTDKLSDVLKKIGGSALSGIKNLVSQFTQLGKASGNINTLTGNVKTLLATMIGFRGITGLFNWTKEAITAGADLTEIDHIVESVFGENMVGYVQNWANSALESFGIASTAAKKYAGTLTAMFQSSDVGIQESNKMAMDLVGLAGDLSAFYNIDTETAYNKIKSGMAGMVRPLRDLGIDLTAATLKEYALAQGIEKSYSSMTQAEKMMLRYKYLMSQTTTQSGDFARTSGSLANSLRILKAYASEVATQIGAGLGAALRHIVVALNSVMKVVLKAAQAFAIFMQTIFGKYKGGASGIAIDGALMDAEDSVGGLADGAEDAAGGLGDADDAAKKLKKDLAVLPFDELNQLAKDQEQASSGKGGSGGGGGGVGGLGDFGDGLFADSIDNVTGKLGELESYLSAWGERIKTAFDNKDWKGLGQAIASGFNDGIDALYDLLDPDKAMAKITPFTNAFAKTFNSFVDAIHWNKLGKTLGRGINILVSTANNLLDPKTGIDFGKIGKAFASGFNGLVEEVDFEKLGNLLGNKFMVTWRTLKGFAEEFDWAGIGKALGTTVNGINKSIKWTEVSDALTTSLNGAFESLARFARTVEWDDLVDNITSGINKFIKDFDWDKNSKALDEFVKNLTRAIVKIIKGTDWKGFGEGLATTLSNLNWLKYTLDIATAIVDALGSTIKGLITKPEGAFTVALVGGLGAVKFGAGIDKLTANLATFITGEQQVGVIQAAFENLFKPALANIAPYLGPVSLAIAGIAAGIAVAKSYIEEDMPKISGDVLSLKEDAENAISKVESLRESFQKSLDDIDADAKAKERIAAPYVKILEDLASKTGDLTKEEQNQKDNALNQLSIIYPDLTDKVDLHAESLSSVVRNIKSFMANVAEMAKAEVYYEQIKEATRQLVDVEKQQYEVDKKIKENKDKLNEAFTNFLPLSQAVEDQFGIHTDSANGLAKALQDYATSQINVNGEVKSGKEWLDALNSVFESEGFTLEDLQAEIDLLREKYRELNGAHTTLEGDIDQLTTDMGGLNKGLTDVQTGMTNTATTATTTGATVKTSFTDALAQAQQAATDINTTGESLPTNLATGITHTQGMPTEVIDQMLKSALSKVDEVDASTSGETIPKEIATGMTNSKSSVEEATKDVANASVQQFDNTLGSASGTSSVFTTKAKAIPSGIAKGITDNKGLAVTAMGKLISDITTEFNKKTTGAGGLSSQMNTGGKKVTSDFIKGLKDLGGFKASTFYDNMFSDVWKKLDKIANDFYKKGQSISQKFANGMESVSIPRPDIHVSSWTPFRVETANEVINFSVPNFTADWRRYAKGGLFTKPLPGILGDAGDEAALPLENRRTMNRIANAIIDNADGNLGISKQDIVDAVVYAMAANSQNQAPINVTATLYTEDNEVLARAVERGNRSRDMRYNPTTAY